MSGCRSILRVSTVVAVWPVPLLGNVGPFCAAGCEIGKRAGSLFQLAASEELGFRQFYSNLWIGVAGDT